MAYAVVFYFEKHSEFPIKEIWKKMESIGLSPNKYKGKIRPHMTLAIYESINCSECENEIKRIGKESNMLTVQANHFGIFPHQPAVIFISPAPNTELLEFQRKIHKILEGKVDGTWDKYLPGKWVPHCTLAQGVNNKDLPAALNMCLQMKLPLELRITQIGIVEFEPTTPLFEINLSKL